MIFIMKILLDFLPNIVDLSKAIKTSALSYPLRLVVTMYMVTKITKKKKKMPLSLPPFPVIGPFNVAFSPLISREAPYRGPSVRCERKSAGILVSLSEKTRWVCEQASILVCAENSLQSRFTNKFCCCYNTV